MSQAAYIRVGTGKYTQLSQENRHQIKALLAAGHNQSEIASTIGVHRSTISRELQRNVANSISTGNDYGGGDRPAAHRPAPR